MEKAKDRTLKLPFVDLRAQRDNNAPDKSVAKLVRVSAYGVGVGPGMKVLSDHLAKENEQETICGLPIEWKGGVTKNVCQACRVLAAKA